MAYEFRLPDIGEGVAEGEVVQWFVKEGDEIREDQPLVSVLTDKANVEIPSPKSGRIARLHAGVGDKVKVGGLLVTIETAGDSSPPRSPTPASTPAVSPGGGSTAAAPSAGAPGPAVSPSGGRPLASPFVRRIAAERGIDLAKVRGSGPGGRIQESDLTGSPTVASTGAVAVPASAAAEGTPSKAPERSAPPATKTVAPEIPSAEIRERIAIRGLRRVIAEHMTESTHRAAHFTYVEEVDVGELVRLRERMSKSFEKQGVSLHYLPFIIKAVVAALKASPRLNATMDDAHQELLVRSVYHIGVATAAPEGLIVPVLRDADRKSLVQIAREVHDLSERGRAGKLTRAELGGSTFTITSLGPLGGILATPILNYPEVGILGVHRIQHRPVIRPDGTIGAGDVMNLSVSLDHRVIDGIEGAQFLALVKGYLEDPHLLFAELA